MLLPCIWVQATFSPTGLRLENEGPTQMRWDEHGGTFVLKVSDLKVRELPAPAAESGIRLEIALSPPETLLQEIQGFAATHSLYLAPALLPAAGLEVKPILAGCHIPERNLFVFCEEAQLQARAKAGGTVELSVTGPFRARRVPCRETDLVIHLTGPAMAQLLSYLFTLMRERM